MKCVKVKHPDRVSATVALKSALGRRKRQAGDGMLCVYKCEECSEPGAPVWHFGHRNKASKNGRKP